MAWGKACFLLGPSLLEDVLARSTCPSSGIVLHMPRGKIISGVESVSLIA